MSKVTRSTTTPKTTSTKAPPPPPPKPKAPSASTKSSYTKGSAPSATSVPTRPKTSVQRSLPTGGPKVTTPAKATPKTTDHVAQGGVKDPKFQKLSQDLEGAKTPAQRQKAANELAGWTRDNLVDDGKLQGYLSRKDVSAEEKQATLGKLALEVNRSEMVLGRAHIGGDGKWEHKGENQGDFVNEYQKLAPNSKTDAWCTKFATSAYQRLGLDLDQATGGKTSPFLSGSRIQSWATQGKDNSGKQLLAADKALASDKTQGDVVTGQDFKGLTQALNKTKKPEERLQAVQDFMKENGAPQPGDLVIRDKNNSVVGASHTLMVEKYDDKTGTLYTIEGNAGDKVQGFSYDLKDPAVAANMGFLARMDPQQFQARVPAEGSPVSAKELLDHAQGVNAHLIDLAGRKGWLHSSDANATSATLSTGDANAWSPKSKTSTR